MTYRLISFIFIFSLVSASESSAKWFEFKFNDAYEFKVLGTGNGEIFAGGAKIGQDKKSLSNSVILKFDGGEWNEVYSDSFLGQFEDIFVRAKNDIYAITEKSIIHFDGSKWEKIKTDLSDMKLRSIFEKNGKLYISDKNGKLLVFDENEWRKDTYGATKNELLSMWPNKDDSISLLTHGQIGGFLTGLVLYRYKESKLEMANFALVSNQSKFDAELSVQRNAVKYNMRNAGEDIIRGRAEFYVEPSAILTSEGDVIVKTISDEADFNMNIPPDFKKKILNIQRLSDDTFLIARRGEQMKHDTGPIPFHNNMLVSDDGVKWKKLEKILITEGQSASKVIKTLPGKQIFALGLTTIFYYDGKDDIFENPVIWGAEDEPKTKKKNGKTKIKKKVPKSK